jgi:hypothetical protein
LIDSCIYIQAGSEVDSYIDIHTFLAVHSSIDLQMGSAVDSCVDTQGRVFDIYSAVKDISWSYVIQKLQIGFTEACQLNPAAILAP